MKHKVKGRKFKRSSSQRKALIKHLAEAIIIRKKIKTTEAKAKELSANIDKLVTTAKKGNLAAAKSVHSFLCDQAAKELLGTVAKKYKDRNGGYTRIIKIKERKGDAARMSVIEFV